MHRRLSYLVVLVTTAVGACWTSLAAAKPIMAYYMPWYVARPHSADWGWHWTMNHFKPDVLNASGERQIASWYYPLIEPYDSSDPAVLEYHVLLMRLGGIEAAVGSTNFHERVTDGLRAWQQQESVGAGGNGGT